MLTALFLHEMKTTNRVVADGRVIRLSTNRARRRTNLSVLICVGEKRSLVNFVYDGQMPENIKLRDKVHITGYMVSYRDRDYSGDMVSVQYFVAETIEKQKTEMEIMFGLEGTYTIADKFVGYFAGTVVRVFGNDPRWGKMVLQVDEDNIDRRYPSRIVFNYMKERFGDLNLKTGDEICLVAGVNTPTKVFNSEEGPEKIIFLDMIANDILRNKPVPGNM